MTSTAIKIAIVGYGKMGQEIEHQAQKLKIPVSRIIQQNNDLSQILFQPDEVVVEFTTPDACVSNLKTLLQKKVPVVCGTTGWLEQLDEIKNLVKETHGSFLYASNFSPGVHIFWNALAYLSKNMNAFDQYEVRAVETHHVHKKDKPSGTAKTCEKITTQNIDRLKTLEIQSNREGEVFGDHHIFFESPEDTIEISHKATNRAGFAKGAIECAKWLHGKKGIFTIEDYMKEKCS